MSICAVAGLRIPLEHQQQEQRIYGSEHLLSSASVSIEISLGL